MVYTAEEIPPLGAECGTGGKKPPKLKHIFAGEAERRGSGKLREMDHLIAKGNKVVTGVAEANDSGTPWENEKDSFCPGRQELETGPKPCGNTIHNSREASL